MSSFSPRASSSSGAGDGTPRSTLKSSASATSTQQASASAAAAASNRRPSALKTKQILDTIKARESVARRASTMTAEEMDSLYDKVSNTLRSELSAKREEVDQMQSRSHDIDSAFNELRQRNKEELAKTERRLSRLQMEVRTLESGEALFGDQESNSKSSPLSSKRASNLSTRILNKAKEVPSPSKMNHLESIADGGSDEEGSEEEESPPPPPPSRGNMTLVAIVTTSEQEETEEDKANDIMQNSIFRNLQKSFDANASSAGAVPTTKVADAVSARGTVTFSSETASGSDSACADNDISPISEESPLTHERIFSEDYKRHYYVDLKTGKSQWTIPTEGILLCT
jgi:hypothetical protein